MNKKTWSWAIVGGVFVGRSHEEIIQVCKAAGFAGIEGGHGLFDSCSEAELQAVGKQYRDAGLQIQTYHLPFNAPDDISAFYETDRRKAVDTMNRAIERSAILGARVGIQHPSTCRHGIETEGFDNFLRQIGRSLDALLPVAQSHGYTIAVENMLPVPGTRFGSRPEHFERFAKEFDHPSLGFCLDTGHALVSLGPDFAHRMFEAMAPRLAAFHLADNAGDRDSHLAPGHGLVDWCTVFRQAAEIRFSGNACIETPPFAPGPDYSVDAYRQMVREADALVRKALRNSSRRRST